MSSMIVSVHTLFLINRCGVWFFWAPKAWGQNIFAAPLWMSVVYVIAPAPLQLLNSNFKKAPHANKNFSTNIYQGLYFY